MKKILLLFISIILLTGCGKVNEEKIVDKFIDDVESSKSYELEANMEIYNNEVTFSYDLNVKYLDDNYFKVKMINKDNDHEQIILKDSESVYVINPTLNKSYKFVSEWPYNSSQSYILNSLVKDIKDSSNVEFFKEEDGYSIKVDVNYPNNNELVYEKLYFDKDKNLVSVYTYDEQDIACIKVVFKKIDYKAGLDEKEFNVDEIIESLDGNENVENTGKLDDILYPLFIPANTYLKGKELINGDNGDRAILTFNGDKNFVLIEEPSKTYDSFEMIPIYGEPTMLNNTIGALSSNSLTWSSDNVDYYLVSNDLSTEELLTIADSINNTVLIEK